MIVWLGITLCQVDCPTGRRRCLGEARKAAIAVDPGVVGKHPYVVLFSSWIDTEFAVGWCFQLYPTSSQARDDEMTTSATRSTSYGGLYARRRMRTCTLRCATWVLRSKCAEFLYNRSPIWPRDPYRHALAMRSPRKVRPFSFLNYRAHHDS